MKYLIGIGAALLASVWWYYLPPGPVCYVEVEFVAPKGTVPLRTVEVMSGPGKSVLTDIEPGETQTTTVYPEDSTGNEVSLFIFPTPDGSKKNIGWGGQRYYPPGTAFRTHIQIDQNGKVIAEKSCKLPCSFD
ncbi:hypothetical protein QCD60_05800 [Pokkaliibacter sp. MBI-7]|uniref:hypothetical protein n=1 Tax=Pokkaliibacter sp. MBI-7 TaxID=3040600 RepID=UPI002447845F|nr:hypothetical protein [Pokkaliibacter sp. MBI-7]MDH2432068.1 hypothetical protein [Pokkaliibacter sp. MBI-7]